MNGYDAIMQGRHGLRNASQLTDTEYGLLSVYIRLERTRGGEEERRIEKERGTSDITHAHRDSLVGRENFFRISISREMTSRCTLRAMKNTRFL